MCVSVISFDSLSLSLATYLFSLFSLSFCSLFSLFSYLFALGSFIFFRLCRQTFHSSLSLRSFICSISLLFLPMLVFSLYLPSLWVFSCVRSRVLCPCVGGCQRALPLLSRCVPELRSVVTALDLHTTEMEAALEEFIRQHAELQTRLQ